MGATRRARARSVKEHSPLRMAVPEVRAYCRRIKHSGAPEAWRWRRLYYGYLSARFTHRLIELLVKPTASLAFSSVQLIWSKYQEQKGYSGLSR